MLGTMDLSAGIAVFFVLMGLNFMVKAVKNHPGTAMKGASFLWNAFKKR